MTDRLLDANELADRLHVPVSWVRQSTRSGPMPCVELGRYKPYEWSAVETRLETCKEPGRTIALRPGLIFKTARRWRWVSENPLELVDPPAMPDAETETLTAAEIGSVLEAYKVLEEAADDAEKPWYAAARRTTTVALSTGRGRDESLGLRWQDVEMLDGLIHVRQQFVRNEITTPKSRAGRRTLPLGDVAAKALEEQYATSRHRAPESILFSHPALGTPLDPSKLTG